MKKPLDLHIFQRVRQLGLPDGQYVVVGSGLLVALGMLEWDDDIEVAVSQDVFDTYTSKGWEVHDEQDKQVLKSDIYDLSVGFGEWSLEDLLSDAMIIRGMPFISPEKLLALKQQMNRPQDLEHITLLQKYLKTSS